MKIFFSLSDRMYLTKAQPVPISASVMNRSAPLSLESTYNTHRKNNNKVVFNYITLQIPEKVYLQVCDIIHDGPAFNRMSLSIDEVIVDLRETERERLHKRQTIKVCCEHSEQYRQNKQT